MTQIVNTVQSSAFNTNVVSPNSLCIWPYRCRFSHDIAAYLAAKQQDLRIPDTFEISDAQPIAPDFTTLTQTHPLYSSVDLNTTCPIFVETGECRSVWKPH